MREVIMIGAGIAGLQRARLLTRAGRAVTVLEGSDRDTASIQGALVSGRRTAAAVVAG